MSTIRVSVHVSYFNFSKYHLDKYENQFINDASHAYEYTSESVPYGKFLELISAGTMVTYQALNKVFVDLYNKEKIDINNYLTVKAARNIINNFNEEIYKTIVTKVNYSKIDRDIHPTALTDETGKLKEILANDIGLKEKNGIAQQTYLYNEKLYDSDLEINNIEQFIDEVIVFGKIPRRSIRIPMPNRTTYSPDFAYVIKTKEGSQFLNLVVETKDVKSNEELREKECRNIEIAGKKFFKALNAIDIDVEIKFEKQLRKDAIYKIIKNYK